MRYIQARYTAGLAFVLGLTMLAQPAVSAAQLRVVTTTTDLKSITEAVGGGKVTVNSIARGREDPHYVQAKPSFMMLARKADLWIRVGMELEIGYEELILDGSRNRKIRIGRVGHLDASQSVLRLEVPKVKVTRDMGDVHPQGNPHYWLDPLNGRIVASTIAGRLVELSPADAETFKKNLATFQRRLDDRMFGGGLVAKLGGEKLWAMELKGTLKGYLKQNGLTDRLGGWSSKMLPLRRRKIVTYHRSWSYFANRFGLTVAAELEPKPGIPPSGPHLANVIKRMKAEAIGVILMEPAYSRKAADLVARRTGATVVVSAISVGGQKEAVDYLTLIDVAVDRLSVAFQAASGPPDR